TAPLLDYKAFDFIDDFNPGSVRPVLFILYTFESLFILLCLRYHISGFQTTHMNLFGKEEQFIHFCYLSVFYVFLVITLFQSISICTGQIPIITVEVIKSISATIAFLFVSLATMWDAERQFFMFTTDPHLENRRGKFITLKPAHPFFVHMRSQAISALACASLYLLHACLMIDYKMTTDQREDKYMPMSLFVFGRWVHNKLEEYDWFQEFASYDRLRI
ncbi:hypothetical protein KR038_007948, partial [Drosophila bunnanda]